MRNLRVVTFLVKIQNHMIASLLPKIHNIMIANLLAKIQKPHGSQSFFQD
jgi:hypothetical protein